MPAGQVQLLGQLVIEDEAAKLHKPFAATVGRRADVKLANAGALGVELSEHRAEKTFAGGFVKFHFHYLTVNPLRAEDVFARLEQQVADAQRHLRDDEVRIFAFGLVAGDDHEDAGDKAATVGNAGSGAEFGLDALLAYGCARRDN